MQNAYMNNTDMQQYFSSLPINIQETIKQSALDIGTIDELRRLAENLMGSSSQY